MVRFPYYISWYPQNANDISLSKTLKQIKSPIKSWILIDKYKFSQMVLKNIWYEP